MKLANVTFINKDNGDAKYAFNPRPLSQSPSESKFVKISLRAQPSIAAETRMQCFHYAFRNHLPIRINLVKIREEMNHVRGKDRST